MSQRHFVVSMLTNCKIICMGYCERELARKYQNPICTFGSDFFVRCDLVSFFFFLWRLLKQSEKSPFILIFFKFKPTDKLREKIIQNSAVQLLQNWWMPCKCSRYVRVMSRSLNYILRRFSNYLLIYFNYILVLLQNRISAGMQRVLDWKVEGNPSRADFMAEC